MNKYTKYLTIKHDYSNINCLNLIDHIYKIELNNYSFDTLWKSIQLPDGKYYKRRYWNKEFTLDIVEVWASKIAKKVNLTDIKEYDVILFKSKNLSPSHFGMYIGDNKFIHLQEGKFCKIDTLNQDYRNSIHSIWKIQTGKNTPEYNSNI